MNGPLFRSSGNINPSRFVSISGDNTVAQSVATEMPIGISQDWTKYPPVPEISNTYAAEAGDDIGVFGAGDVCNLMAGSGGWNAGDLLTPDASGQGIVISSTAGSTVGARALTSANAGELGRVVVVFHPGS